MPQGPGTYGNKKGRPAKKKTKKPTMGAAGKLTAKQKKLPDFLREKILKSKSGKTKMYKPLLNPKK
jgi:hypothetical protein